MSKSIVHFKFEKKDAIFALISKFIKGSFSKAIFLTFVSLYLTFWRFCNKTHHVSKYFTFHTNAFSVYFGYVFKLCENIFHFNASSCGIARSNPFFPGISSSNYSFIYNKHSRQYGSGSNHLPFCPQVS